MEEHVQISLAKYHEFLKQKEEIDEYFKASKERLQDSWRDYYDTIHNHSHIIVSLNSAAGKNAFKKYEVTDLPNELLSIIKEKYNLVEKVEQSKYNQQIPPPNPWWKTIF